MVYYIKLYLVSLAVFFALDMLWLGVIAGPFYKTKLGYLMAPDVNWPAALVFYALFILGALVFVVIPGLKENSVSFVVVRAALFGLITYATYDLTNLATVRDWPLIITVIDLAWGMVLTTLVSLAGFFSGRWMA